MEDNNLNNDQMDNTVTDTAVNNDTQESAGTADTFGSTDVSASADTSTQGDAAFDVPQKKKKKSPLPLVAAGIAAACVGVTAAVSHFGSPKANIKAEITKNYEDYRARETVRSVIFDDDMEKLLAGGDYTVEGSVKIDENTMDERLNGMGLSISSVTAASEKKASADIGLNYNGADLVRIMIASDDKTTRLHIPKLFSASFSVDNENVMMQLSKSAVFAQAAKEYLNESGDFSIAPFAMTDFNGALYALKGKVGEFGKAALDEADAALTYEKGEKGTAPDGSEAYNYTVTLPAQNAKQCLTGFIGNIKNSEEYKKAVSTGVEYVYSTKPDVAKQYGDKDAVAKTIDDGLDELVKSIDETETEDIKINVMAYKDGINFGVNQPIGGVNVKIDGNYDRSTRILKVDAEFEKDGEKLACKYNDSISTNEGVINEKRSFTVESNGESTIFTTNADYNKADSTLKGSVEVTNGSDVVKAAFDGTAAKTDGKLEIKANSVEVGDKSANVKMEGDYTLRTRTEEPREINSAKEIKLSELGLMEAVGLYNEAKENLGSIAGILGMN
ncbi:MAG: hypothetical protein IKS17_09175 [Firmicutes bacterium]|nr:hypothetical protein [Bacillota bacterium]